LAFGVIVKLWLAPWLTTTLPEGVILPPALADAVIVYVFRAKVAVTVLAAFIVTEQVPVPVHAPDHPVKVEFVLGDAARVTDVPALYASLQSDPQLIPAGVEVTVPLPVPALLTVSVFD